MCEAMKLSKYNIILTDFPDSRSVYIYNTLTGGEVILLYDFFNALTKMENKIHCKQKGKLDIERLKKIGILVESQIDETNIVKYIFNKIKYDAFTFSATILTTYNCNLDCVYCYQKGARGEIATPRKYGENSFKFLRSQIANSKGLKKFNLHIFGGEPLLNLSPILYLSENLKNLCKAQKIDFISSLTTNGTLLTKDVVLNLQRQRLRNIQITLDGSEEIHDKRRFFKDGKGSFQRIINNLEYIPKNINIDLRINIDKQNIENIPLLFDFLCENNLKKRITIDLVLTKKTAQNMGHCKKYVINTTDQIERYIELHYLAFRKGLQVANRINEGLCGAQCENSLTIDPYGDLYKCAGLAGDERFKIGNIKTGVDSFRHADFLTIDSWMDCLDCSYIVLCASGCLHQACVEQGDIRKKLCEKAFLKIAVEPLLKLKYFQKMRQKGGDNYETQ